MIYLKKWLVICLAVFMSALHSPLLTIESIQGAECPICTEILDIETSYKLACNHVSCINCLHNLTRFSLKETDSRSLGCPQCKSPLDETDLRTICPNPEALQRVKSILDFASARKDPRFKHCPTADCKGYFIDTYGVGRNIKCSTCQESYCSACQQNHKQNMSCEKYQQLLGASSSSSNKKGKGKSLDETMTEQWVKANTKQCPNCQTVIEKKGGCKKMHCYDCKHIFDWEPK